MIQSSLHRMGFNRIGPHELLYHRCIQIAYFAKCSAKH